MHYLHGAQVERKGPGVTAHARSNHPEHHVFLGLQYHCEQELILQGRQVIPEVFAELIIFVAKLCDQPICSKEFAALLKQKGPFFRHFLQDMRHAECTAAASSILLQESNQALGIRPLELTAEHLFYGFADSIHALCFLAFNLLFDSLLLLYHLALLLFQLSRGKFASFLHSSNLLI